MRDPPPFLRWNFINFFFKVSLFLRPTKWHGGVVNPPVDFWVGEGFLTRSGDCTGHCSLLLRICVARHCSGGSTAFCSFGLPRGIKAGADSCARAFGSFIHDHKRVNPFPPLRSRPALPLGLRWVFFFAPLLPSGSSGFAASSSLEGIQL